jgi:DNA polymerase-3 subunit beta
MKFQSSSNELLKHLQIAQGSISNNPVIPILDAFLFKLEKGLLQITASDLETTIITEVKVTSDQSGVIAVPAKILVETLKALPSQPIDFDADDETNAITITSAYGKYKLSGENGADYPETPIASDASSVTMPSSLLNLAINTTIFATTSDELRPAMTGVYFQIEPNAITFVATDAHKLVKFALKLDNKDISTTFIVPKKALNLLKSALSVSETVSIRFNKKNAFFSFGDYLLACRLIDGRFPDYNAVIPVDNPNMMSINRLDFLNSLKRLAIYANKTTNQVLLKIEKSELKISSQDLDFSNEAEESIKCEFSGDAMHIAFNAKFLIEMLSVLNEEIVVLEMSVPNRAGILKPAEQDPGQDMLMLVMPVMLNTAN